MSKCEHINVTTLYTSGYDSLWCRDCGALSVNAESWLIPRNQNIEKVTDEEN